LYGEELNLRTKLAQPIKGLNSYL